MLIPAVIMMNCLVYIFSIYLYRGLIYHKISLSIVIAFIFSLLLLKSISLRRSSIECYKIIFIILWRVGAPVKQNLILEPLLNRGFCNFF